MYVKCQGNFMVFRKKQAENFQKKILRPSISFLSQPAAQNIEQDPAYRKTQHANLSDPGS